MAAFGIGVVAGCLKQASPAEAAAAARRIGIEGLQIPAGPPPGQTVSQWADTWRKAAADSSLAIFSTVTGFPQERYTTIATIHQTGGLVPDEPAEANVQRVIDAARFTRAVGADLLTFHAGFIPAEESDPVFAKLLDRLGRCADAAGELGVRIGLESGQETAAALEQFLAALNRPSVGCNFDPANMILYGRQQPLEAVGMLVPRTFQVHAKDGTWSDSPGEAWGREVPLGTGAVDFARFVPALRSAGFAGNLVIEREAGANPLADIATGVELLRKLRTQTGC